MLVCAHCGSQYIVYDREYVAGTGWVDRPRCGKCGREKFKEISKTSTDIEPVKLEGELSPLQLGESIVKKEDNNMAQCKEPGCERWAAAYGYCNKHFSETFSITVGEYNAEKNSRSENPEAVAKRIFLQRSQNDRPAPTPNPPKPAPPRQAVDVTVFISKAVQNA